MPVTVTLQAHALTTLQRVLDELGMPSDGDVQDSLLNGYINAASSMLMSATGRVFHRADDTTELVAGQGSTRLGVSRAPILAVTSVTLNGTALDAAEYTVDDAALGWLYREAGWPWSAGVAPGLDGGPVPGDEKKNVAVVYDGGFVTRAQAQVGGVAGDTTFVGQPVTLPDEIEDAAIQLACSRWKGRGRDVRVSAQSFEASGLTFTASAIPPDIALVVAKWARVAHA